jgi:outer membrane protein, heavy metal efflux system
MTYTSIPERVLKNNPQIQAALWTIKVAESRMTQSGRLRNPNLVTSFTSNAQTPERSTGVGIQQSFPITARLRLEKNVSALKIEEARTEVNMVARNVIESTLTTTVRWYGNRQRKSIIEDQIRLANDLAEFLSTQSTKGEISSLEAMHASLEAEELTLTMRPLELERKQLESELRILLGLHPGVPIQLKGTLPTAQLSSAKNILMESRPDYRLLQSQIDTTLESIKLARANRISDISLQLIHQWNREEDMPIGIEKERSAGIQLSIPLPLWNRNQGRIAELNNKLKGLESTLLALELSISNHADAAFTGMVEHLANYLQIKDQSLPKRIQYQQALESSYREGLSSFEMMLRARDQILKLRLTQSDALTSFHIHRVKYQSETGNLPIFHE